MVGIVGESTRHTMLGHMIGLHADLWRYPFGIMSSSGRIARSSRARASPLNTVTTAPLQFPRSWSPRAIERTPSAVLRTAEGSMGIGSRRRCYVAHQSSYPTARRRTPDPLRFRGNLYLDRLASGNHRSDKLSRADPRHGRLRQGRQRACPADSFADLSLADVGGLQVG